MDGQADWVRLSLDSGTDATFQANAQPAQEDFDPGRASAPRYPIIKDAPTRMSRSGSPTSLPGAGAEINDTAIVENLHEIAHGGQAGPRQPH